MVFRKLLSTFATKTIGFMYVKYIKQEIADLKLLLILSLTLCVLSARADEAKGDSARMEVERLHRLKDSLYNKASAEAQAKYNAEFGNDQLQEENHFVSRSRIYIIIISILLLGVGCWVLVRQRRLIALQKRRLSEDTKTLEELQLQYGR